MFGSRGKSEYPPVNTQEYKLQTVYKLFACLINIKEIWEPP